MARCWLSRSCKDCFIDPGRMERLRPLYQPRQGRRAGPVRPAWLARAAREGPVKEAGGDTDPSARPAMRHGRSELEIPAQVHLPDLFVAEHVPPGCPSAMMVPSLTIYALSQMPRVSRTLWSVIRIPIPRSLRYLMIC